MIASSIAVGIALVTTKIIENSNKGMAKLTADFEAIDLENYFRSILSKGQNCRNTFRNDKGVTGVMRGFNNTNIDMVDISPATTETTPLTPTTAIKYYEISGGSTAEVSVFTNTDGLTEGPSPQNRIILKPGAAVQADRIIPQFPQWELMSIKIFEARKADGSVVPAGTGIYSGVCQVKFEINRVKNTKQTFGSRDKAIWLMLDCAWEDTTAGVGNEYMDYCTPQAAGTTGYWTLYGDTISDGIKFNEGPVHVGDDLVVSGAISVESDERIKRDQIIINQASEKIEELNGYYYFLRHEEFPYKKFNQERQIGFFAQEVERVFPEAVGDVNGLKNVRYTMLIPVLVEAHKEQERKIQEQNKKIEKLNQKIELLIKKLDSQH